MQYETLTYERSDRIATITLNRPEVLNAADDQMLLELNQAWLQFRHDHEAWVAILTGSGERAFCAGRDVKEQAAQDSAGLRTQIIETPYGFGGPMPTEHDIWKPIICAVNGICAGLGVNLLVAADLALCAEHAEFLEPHVSRAWMPPAAVLLPLKINYGAAFRMLTMGAQERMSAQRAYEVGLVTEVVPKEQLLPRAREIAEAIMQNGPLAVRGVKQVMQQMQHMTLAEAIALCSRIMDTAWRSQDAAEGAQSFVEKRKPVWQAR